MKILGSIDYPCHGRLIRVLRPNGRGGEYEELYRPDGSWPFNLLHNFDLKPGELDDCV